MDREKVFTGKIVTTSDERSDSLIVMKDVPIEEIVIAYNRIIFSLDANGRVVGAAVVNASKGMNRADLRKPQYERRKV